MLSNPISAFPILQQAQLSISKLQKVLIGVLEHNDLTPINIRDFLLCYGHISSISGCIKGEDEAAEQLFIAFLSEYIHNYIVKKPHKQNGEEFLDFLIKKWNNYKIYLFFMENVFFKIKKFMKNGSLAGIALNLMKTEFFNPEMERINSIIISFLEQERNDQNVPRDKILMVINVIYLKKFIILLSFLYYLQVFQNFEHWK